MSKYNLLDIHEGKSFEDSQEKSREEKHPEKKTIDKIRALMAKEKKVDENEAVDLAIEASQAKAGIKEARVDRDVEERIEGLLHRELKRKFLFAFEDLYSDLIEEDPFHAEDVINHLNNEMHKHLSSFQNTGDKFAGMEESFDSLAKKLDKQKGIDKDEAAKIAGSIAAKKAAGAGKGPTAKQKKRMNEEDKALNMTASAETLRKIIFKLLDDGQIQPETADDILNAVSNSPSDNVYEADNYVDEIGEGAMQPGEADLEAGVKGNMDAYTEEMGEDKMAPSVEALFRKIRSGLKKSDKNFQRMEIDMYIDSLMRDLDRGDFDGVEQYSMEDHEEDLFNMVADKQLQEHFGRFMKKYQ
mgnify:CR=1 FL=1|jgi:hypothetical protein